jgi:predicted protein tyrosine phosphatase
MPYIVVCPLSEVAASVARSRASHLVSLLGNELAVSRPPTIAEANHLLLTVHDIIEPVGGLVAPGREHVGALVDFVAGWNRKQAMVVHCHAGISRSTAAAFIALCAMRPDRDERAIARALRDASVFATPNRRLVALADELLQRDGRMVAAVAAIGVGEAAFESVPFALAVEGVP